jgi:hypothetical protein
MRSNSCIVGFFGRSGDIVDAIGLYVKIEKGPMEKQVLTDLPRMTACSNTTFQCTFLLFFHSLFFQSGFNYQGWAMGR